MLSLTVQGVKLSFLSKKCIFRAENDIFLKSAFYAKIISGPKYIFLVGQKYFFCCLIQILPTYALSHELCPVQLPEVTKFEDILLG